jgi:hypothetical protein
LNQHCAQTPDLESMLLARMCLSAGVKRLIIRLAVLLVRQKIPWSSRMSLKNGKPVIARRTLLVGGAALGVMPSRRAFSQLSDPLKVGFLTVLTGPLAAGGKQQIEGAAFYLKERGGMLAGRKVELITQDTTGSPAVARNKTQELVELHKVRWRPTRLWRSTAIFATRKCPSSPPLRRQLSISRVTR